MSYWLRLCDICKTRPYINQHFNGRKTFRKRRRSRDRRMDWKKNYRGRELGLDKSLQALGREFFTGYAKAYQG